MVPKNRSVIIERRLVDFSSNSKLKCAWQSSSVEHSDALPQANVSCTFALVESGKLAKLHFRPHARYFEKGPISYCTIRLLNRAPNRQNPNTWAITDVFPLPGKTTVPRYILNVISSKNKVCETNYSQFVTVFDAIYVFESVFATKILESVWVMFYGRLSFAEVTLF